jgi:hypothetical protein
VHDQLPRHLLHVKKCISKLPNSFNFVVIAIKHSSLIFLKVIVMVWSIFVMYDNKCKIARKRRKKQLTLGMIMSAKLLENPSWMLLMSP